MTIIRTKTIGKYFDWRARMISIATILIFALFVLGLAYVVTIDYAYLSRLGIFLQFIGVFSLVPDVVGRDTVFGFLQPPQLKLNQRELLRLYERKNRSILVGNALMSVAAAGAMFYLILFPQTPGLGLWLRPLGLLGFAWLNLVMLQYVFRYRREPAPEAISLWFLPVDFIITIPGLPFSALSYICLSWLPRLIGFTFRNGIYRVLLIITLPCLLVGLMFELIGTF